MEFNAISLGLSLDMLIYIIRSSKPKWFFVNFVEMWKIKRKTPPFGLKNLAFTVYSLPFTI